MWLPLLRIVNPASAYVQRQKREGHSHMRRRSGARSPVVFERGPDRHEEIRRRREEIHRRLAARRRELEATLGSSLVYASEKLVSHGSAVLSAGAERFDITLVRFWNRSAIL